MGLIDGLLGIGRSAGRIGSAVGDVAEVFTINKTKRMELDHALRQAALAQLTGEFRAERSWFDTLIDGINRLPRPVMAGGTIGLFVYAMVDPVAFAARMQGLVLVPEPLWWLLGAVVSFYFGARELHHLRAGSPISTKDVARVVDSIRAMDPEGPEPDPFRDNAAVQEWRSLRQQP